MAFAFVRNLRTSSGANLKSYAQIKSAEAHAKRLDLTSKERQEEGRSHAANYFWSKAGEGLEGGGADYAAAFKEHKRQAGVKSERKGAALALHLLVGVSPEWLAETGDPRDLNNPRVQEVIKEAKKWAESWMGEGAVWAVRYDTDETGAGVVDILASPVREGRAGRGQPKPQISVNKALKALQDEVAGAKNSYEAMQTSWASWAQENLDPSLKRGQPREQTRREHLTPEEFKNLAEKRAQLEADRAQHETLTMMDSVIMHKERQKAEQRLEPLRAIARHLENQIADLKADRKEAEKSFNKLADSVDALEARKEALEGEVTAQERDREEAAKILREARIEAKDIRLGARAWADDHKKQHRKKDSAAMEENAALHAKIADWQNFVEGVKVTLATVLGDRWPAIRERINSDWAKNPKNPDAKKTQSLGQSLDQSR